MLKVVVSVLCSIVPHGLARIYYFVLAREKQSNCIIFAQACVEDLIFLLKWLMHMFHFCISTVSTVELVINKTKPRETNHYANFFLFD